MRITDSPAPLLAAAATAALLAATTPTAAAVEDPTLDFENLGLADSTRLVGRSSNVDLNLPVPPGTAPQVLRGRLQVPVEFSGGVVAAYSGDHLLGTANLQVDDGVADLTVPLTDAEVSGGIASVRLRTVLDAESADWCHVDDSTPAVLTDAEVAYTGTTVAPSEIADFLPPVLEEISIHVPADPTTAESSAALEVATALTSRYSSQDPAVTVVALPAGKTAPSEPARPFERQIVIATGEQAGTTVEEAGRDTAFLRLRGEDGTLQDQARLLASRLLPLAVSDTATVANVSGVPDLAPEAGTVAELGNYDLTAEGLTRPTVGIGLDQSRLGAFVGAVDLHLTGGYVPLPQESGGQLIFRVGDTVLDQLPVDDSGSFDHQLSIPPELLGRYARLDVELRSTGPLNCGTTQPLSLWIDGASTVATDLADSPADPGFAALPQGLAPTVDVALAEGGLADLRRAVTLVTGVQSLGSTRLRPNLVPWEEATTAGRAALFVDAIGDDATHLPLPVRRDGDTFSVVGSDEELTVPDHGIGGVQVTWDEENFRQLVVATSDGSPEQLDRTLDWLSQDRERWFGLQGQALLQTAGSQGDPVDLVTAAQRETAETSAGNRVWWLTGAVIVVLLAVAVLALLLRRVRRPTPPAAETRPDDE